MPDMNKGAMSVRDAGKKGGETTAQTHGREFYETIGKKGGKKGGEAVKQKYGPAFYKEIGHKGGQKVKQLIAEGKQSHT